MSTPAPNPHLEDDCAICLNSLQDDGTAHLKELPCEHLFHAACEMGIVMERITAGTGDEQDIYLSQAMPALPERVLR